MRFWPENEDLTAFPDDDSKGGITQGSFPLHGELPVGYNANMSKSVWPDGTQTAALIERAKEGNPQAVESLLDRHRDGLRRMIQLRLDQKIQRRVDVSDVVQEVLIEASRRLKDYLDNPIMAFHLWVRQIAKDRIIDAHRRHRVSAKRSIDREQPLVVNGDNDHSTMELAGALCDPSLTPAAAATQREIAKQIEAAIELLPSIDQEILLMRHYEQLSNQDIAAALELTEPAASMRYLRALRRLREIIDQSNT